MKNHVDVVIIGGGAVGLSVAYHLGSLGGCSVCLFERNQLSSGTTWHAAGIVGPLRSSLNMTRIAMYATELFPRLEKETGQPTGYRQTGGFWLAQTEERMTELRRICGMGRRAGLGVEMISGPEVGQTLPFLRSDDLAGALYVEEDGQVSPVDLCMAYAAGARSRGVVIEEGCGVTGFVVDKDRVNAVLLDDGRRVDCGTVVLCAGLWSRELANEAGVKVPLQAVEHMYVVTEPMNDLPVPTPIVRDLDSGLYLKGDTGKLVIGGFERNAKPWNPEANAMSAPYLTLDEDWDHFTPFMKAGIHRVPALKSAGIRMFMNGPESFTPDTRPLIGEFPQRSGLFIAAGFNSVGVMSSAGVGHALAHWIVNGKPPFDLWEVDIARVDPKWSNPKFLSDRMREAIYNQFAMHWPLKQPESGRNVRCPPLFEKLQQKGAVFGTVSTWERPLWYAENEDERKFIHTYKEQPWWNVATREAMRMAQGVALIELTPFTKIELKGPNALNALQYLCAGDMDMEVGLSRYTTLLNESGGIEADVTVTRLERNLFRIISSAATRYRDLARIRRLLGGFKALSLEDITSHESVIGVMGPMSREVLTRVSDDCDWSVESFPFTASRKLKLAGKPVLALRRSFVGELGWELYVQNEHACVVFDRLCKTAAEFGLTHLGHLALDGCRLEKRYGHWGHEWGPDVTPLEAGIEFTVAKGKSGFIGYDALERQRKIGVNQRLILLEVDSDFMEKPLLLHDEPVLLDGEIVGLTTSGGLGPRTGLSLAFAMIQCTLEESFESVCDKPYVIDVADRLFTARTLLDAPYDPDGMLMRG